MMYNDPKLITALKMAVNEAAFYIKDELEKVTDSDVEEKDMNSLVTYVDKNAEKLLVARLSQILPEAGFITEEETEDITNREWTWIIDPLDGTTNYLHQIPYFSVSVALQQGKESVIGVVHEVMRGEQFFAVKGKGAFLNEKPISISKKEKLNQVLIATGFPYSNNYDIDKYFEILKTFLLKTRGMRRLGSAALDLSYVAVGRLGAYYESTLNMWDIAAGALIVQEAGGIVSDFRGSDTFLSNGQILATAPQFYDEILQLLSVYDLYLPIDR